MRPSINYNLIDRKSEHASSLEWLLSWRPKPPIRHLLERLTHMDGSWEGGALSEDRESVAQVSHVVLGLHFVSVERFVTLRQQTTVINQKVHFCSAHAKNLT